jgi:hypothetical protein
MILGFNHNVMYRGEVFHVQTEDSGVEIPNIVTLLYRGGVILCSAKTSYADILKMDNLEEVVEELMKEQHKGVMRRLKAGEFDERIFYGKRDSEANDTATDESFANDSGAEIPLSQSAQETAAPLPDAPVEHGVCCEEPASGGQDTSRSGESLDEAILSFFGIHE